MLIKQDVWCYMTDINKSYESQKKYIIDEKIQYILIAVISIITIIIAVFSDYNLPKISEKPFLTIHVVLEFVSIVASFAVFSIGWFGYRQTKNIRDLIIGITFFLTGSFDFIHTMSYKGMPAFLGENTVGLAAFFWIIARMTAGLGLVAAVFASPDPQKKEFKSAHFLLGSIFFIMLVIYISNRYGLYIGNAMFDSSKAGLTNTKIILEIIIILLYFIAFLFIKEKAVWTQDTVKMFKKAMLFAIFGELCFILYSGPYDYINALGHVFKAYSYILMMNALFVAAVRAPYEKLSITHTELENSYIESKKQSKQIEKLFSTIGSALSSSIQIDGALDKIAELAKEMLSADCAIVMWLDKSGKPKISVQKGCDDCIKPHEVTMYYSKQVIESREIKVLENVNDIFKGKQQHLKCNCARSIICAPMSFQDEPLGVIALFSRDIEYSQDHGRILEGFASHAAVAIHNAISYERESKIADVLQRSFMSASTIITDKFEIAQVYNPATDEALIGGDFYDVVNLDEDNIAIIIGDVSGKGLPAAVHTAMAKYALRAYLSDGYSPADIMKRFDKLTTKNTDDETFITLFIGILNIHTGKLIYCNAGHEPPIYCKDGQSIELDSTGPIVGLGLDLDFNQKEIVLEPNSTLLLYTDGISEARKGDEMMGSDRIAEELKLCKIKDSEDIAQCIFESAQRYAGGDLSDDAAILAVKALDK
ncbi:MAG: MASE3 domain-containing protein [Armatimonadota bacterium]